SSAGAGSLRAVVVCGPLHQCLEEVRGGGLPSAEADLGAAAAGVQRGVARLVVDKAAQVERSGEPLAALLGVGGLLFPPEMPAFALALRAFPRDPQPRRPVMARGGDAAAVAAEGHGPNHS